jgi:hypothetical protein
MFQESSLSQIEFDLQKVKGEVLRMSLGVKSPNFALILYNVLQNSSITQEINSTLREHRLKLRQINSAFRENNLTYREKSSALVDRKAIPTDAVPAALNIKPFKYLKVICFVTKSII